MNVYLSVSSQSQIESNLLSRNNIVSEILFLIIRINTSILPLYRHKLIRYIGQLLILWLVVPLHQLRLDSSAII